MDDQNVEIQVKSSHCT